MAEFSASARLPGIRRHPGIHEHLTHSRGRWNWKPRLARSSAWITSGPAREQVSDNGCTKNGRVGLLRRSAHVLTHYSSAGTTGAFGVPVGVSRERGSGVVPLAARRLRSASNGASESKFRQQGAVVHWCARARVDRLQNSVSGVWLKKRTSVAAEVSGRGLALRD